MPEGPDRTRGRALGHAAGGSSVGGAARSSMTMRTGVPSPPRLGLLIISCTAAVIFCRMWSAMARVTGLRVGLCHLAEAGDGGYEAGSGEADADESVVVFGLPPRASPMPPSKPTATPGPSSSKSPERNSTSTSPARPSRQS